MRSDSQSVPPQKTVVLRFDTGSFSEGFQITLRILQDGRQIGDDRSFPLPKSPDIPKLYQDWERTYRSIGQLRKTESQEEKPPEEPHLLPIRIQFSPGQITNHGIWDSDEAKKQFSNQLISWFSQPAFMDLSSHICLAVSGEYESLPIAIHSKTGCVETDRLLRKLPWHLWSLFEKLDDAEPILISDYSHPVPSFGSQTRILVILGSDEGGLDLRQDSTMFSGLEGAKVLTGEDFKSFHKRDASGEFNRFNYLILSVANQDLETLHDLIYQNPWDILFFAGHSSSDRACQEGQIEICPGLCVPIEAFSAAIRQSVKRGLKLAIFNSCDGLGLAEALMRNRVPNVIAMREPVPDRVAHKFLSCFLREFLQGTPLSKAIHHARKQLYFLEHVKPPCPGASWLPILIKNPNQPDLIWPPLPRSKRSKWAIPTAIAGGLVGLMLATFLISTLPENSAGSPQITLSSKPTPSPQPIEPFGRFKTFADIQYPEGQFAYAGSTTWGPIETGVLSEIVKAAPNFKLEKLDAPKEEIPGSIFGLEMLKQGKVMFAHVSRVPLENDPQLDPYPIAYTFKAIAVHPGVDLQSKGLTLNQIKGICKGDIRNWAAVGGPDLPIRLIDRIPQSKSKLGRTLGDQCPAAQIDGIRTTSAAILKAKDIPGSVMITAATLVVPQCSLQILPVVNESGTTVYPYIKTPDSQEKACQDYPRRIDVEVFRNGSYLGNQLRDVLSVYLNENNPKSLEVGGAYINALRSCEGQTLLEKAGYLPYSETDSCSRTMPK